MHGEGEMTYKDGSKYTGTFVWNVRHGQGVYEDAKGNTYEGAWYQNKKHGRGTQTYRYSLTSECLMIMSEKNK